MFFWNSLDFFNNPTVVGNLISGSSAFSKISLNIWKFKVHVLLKPGLENFEHYFISIEMSAKMLNYNFLSWFLALFRLIKNGTFHVWQG